MSQMELDLAKGHACLGRPGWHPEPSPCPREGRALGHHPPAQVTLLMAVNPTESW